MTIQLTSRHDRRPAARHDSRRASEQGRLDRLQGPPHSTGVAQFGKTKGKPVAYDVGIADLHEQDATSTITVSGDVPGHRDDHLRRPVQRRAPTARPSSRSPAVPAPSRARPARSRSARARRARRTSTSCTFRTRSTSTAAEQSPARGSTNHGGAPPVLPREPPLRHLAARVAGALELSGGSRFRLAAARDGSVPSRETWLGLARPPAEPAAEPKEGLRRVRLAVGLGRRPATW